MGVVERRQRERKARIKLILNCAGRLFSQKGFENTSMDEIANLAEIATGTIYSYFKSKEELLYSLLLPTGEKYQAGFAEIISDEKEPADLVLKRWADFYYHSYLEMPDLFRIIWTYDASRIETIVSEENHDRLRQIMRWNVREMERLLARGVAQGIFRPVNPKVTSILIWNLSMGLYQYELNRQHNKGRDYLKFMVEAAVDFVLESLKAG